MAKRCLKAGRKSKNCQNEARNLPTWGCKSMMEGPKIMLGVFITLLYMYTMPNKHYSSKPTSLRYHLMAKRCLKAGRKSKSEARNLRYKDHLSNYLVTILSCFRIPCLFDVHQLLCNISLSFLLFVLNGEASHIARPVLHTQREYNIQYLRL